MTNGGVFSLGDIAITAAQTYVGPWITNLGGVSAISIDLEFLYGSAGTSGKVYIQTSLRQATAITDAGIDVACMTFTTASKSICLNVTGLNPVVAFVPTDGAMTNDTSQDGTLGDRFRMKVITIGTYGGQSTVSCRISAR